MTAVVETVGDVRELTLDEVDQVNGGLRFVAGAIIGGLIYDAAKAMFNAYGEAMSETETSTDYENHFDYEGIGGPF